jgi:hypothetical protein
MRKNELVHVLGDLQGSRYVNEFGTLSDYNHFTA